MLRVESLESRYLLSRYILTDLGDFHGRAMNDAGEVAGLDAAGYPAIWDRGHITELEKPAGFLNAVPNAINAWGEVAGYGTLPDRTTDALFWDARGVVDLGGGPFAQANALNDLGQVAGRYTSDDTPPGWQAAVWSPYRPVNRFGWAFFSQANAINDAGQATGNDSIHAFRWQAGTLEDLPMPTPDGESSTGTAINRRGDIAGSENHRNDGPANEAVVWWANGDISTLGTLPRYSQTFAYGINNQGQVVGEMWGNVSVPNHAFLWDATHGMRDLNNLTKTKGFTLYWASTITDQGIIFAAAGSPDGRAHSVILVPSQDAWLGWALALQARR